MFSNLRLKKEYEKSVEGMIEIINSNSGPSINIDNSISSTDRLEYFKNNMPIVADYYFGELRAYDSDIFIKDVEVFGTVISMDWDKQKIQLLVPDVMNIVNPTEEKTITFICPVDKTYVLYGKNVIYDDSLILENGLLDFTKIIRPGVFVAISYKDSFYDSEAEWCVIY